MYPLEGRTAAILVAVQEGRLCEERGLPAATEELAFDSHHQMMSDATYESHAICDFDELQVALKPLR